MRRWEQFVGVITPKSVAKTPTPKDAKHERKLYMERQMKYY